MKIEKLNSGSYRIRQQFKGKRYQVTLPYKPTQKEALSIMAERMSEASSDAPRIDFRSAALHFITDGEKSGKSPSTTAGYMSIVRNTSEWFLDMRLSEIENKDVQREMDRYSSTHSPKSSRNHYGFIRTVLAENRPELHLSIKLPSAVKQFEYEPSTDDISRILDACSPRYLLALKCAVLGMRRGEFLAITADDIDKDNVLTINKDLVIDKDNNRIIKDRPKTSASNRRILIPADLANAIRERGCVFEGNPHTINEYLHKLQDQLGIPRFRLHLMRHFAAAYLLKEGFTTSQIEDFCGWEHGSSVMRRVYSYNLDPHETQKEIVGAFDSIL